MLLGQLNKVIVTTVCLVYFIGSLVDKVSKYTISSIMSSTTYWKNDLSTDPKGFIVRAPGAYQARQCEWIY